MCECASAPTQARCPSQLTGSRNFHFYSYICTTVSSLLFKRKSLSCFPWNVFNATERSARLWIRLNFLLYIKTQSCKQWFALCSFNSLSSQIWKFITSRLERKKIQFKWGSFSLHSLRQHNTCAYRTNEIVNGDRRYVPAWNKIPEFSFFFSLLYGWLWEELRECVVLFLLLCIIESNNMNNDSRLTAKSDSVLNETRKKKRVV